VRAYVAWGAGPRASQCLVLGAKARAVLQGRRHATIDDVKAVALPALRHRIKTNFQADADGVSSDRIVEMLLAAANDGEPESKSRGLLPEIFKSRNAR
jgi:MoxR-like ATPase